MPAKDGPSNTAVDRPVRRRHGTRFPIVGIGASAGGVEAMTRLFRALAVDTGMGFVIVSHLDPSHGSMLTEIVARATRMPVSEITDRMVVAPNRVHIIPPGTTIVIAGGVLQVSPRKEARGPHRPIDQFFRSLGEDRGHAAIGVILSGSDTDGTRGLQGIKSEGGITLAQDESAQHDTMPRSAVNAGCVDFILSPEGIADELARISRHPYVVDPAEAARAPGLGRILEQLRLVTGVDFSQYKRNTIYRRVHRRAALHKTDTLRDYARLLQSDPAEVQALYQDVLINVTAFFRNPDSFDALKSKVFGPLVKDRSRHDPVRIWVMGCSTGEEAYSIAISFAEASEALGRQIPVQIFATDLNGSGIETARAGVYPKTIAHDVSPERLRRYFVDVDGSYRIIKAIRDLCVFARHNLLTEPPFSRVDLISCRNLLIYLDPSLQQRVVPILHYALRSSGFLWLGNSETIGSHRDLFEVEDAKYKLYVKKNHQQAAAVVLPSHYRGPAPTALRAGAAREAAGVAGDLLKEADRIVLTKYTPPGVIVSDSMEILQFRGDTGPYLTPAAGKASFSLLKMLREGLLVAVRGAIHRARREKAPVLEHGLRVKSNGGDRPVDVQVVPIRAEGGSETCFLVLFQGAAFDARAAGPARRSRGKSREAREVGGHRETAERKLARANQELAATREYLQSVIEQQEAANEELQAANEEVQSANEELQSINEELETSKEEVQSSNEELATVNEELQNRNLELSSSNNDFVNLFNSVQMAIVMLGADLRIRRFTPMAEKVFNLIPADVGRPIGNIRLNIDVANVEELLRDMIEAGSVKELDVQDREGRWYSLRLRPYRTLENHIEGAVLVLVDVDNLKRSQDAIRRQNELLEQTHEPIFMWELESREVTYWNRGAEEVYGVAKGNAVGRCVHELLQTSPLPRVAEEELQRSDQWAGELTHRRADGEGIVVESRMVLVRERDRPPVVIETTRPITERKRMEQSLRQRAEELAQADRLKNEFLATLAHELRNPLAPLSNLLGVLRSPDLDPDTLRRACDTMTRQVQGLTRLTDDLLDVARITQGRIHLRKELVNLGAAVERVVDLNRLGLDARGQQLELVVPSEAVYVEADAVRLDQVINNLLSNASKFTPRGGHLWLQMERADAEAGEPTPGDVQAVIRLRDDGVGIPADVLPRVFDLFVQADRSLDRVHGGLGIGLTLVRRLVELHGGSIDVSSPGPGQGSEFIVRLPALSAGALPSGDASTAAPSEVARRRVLVVDDSVDGADSLAQLLRLVGHDVTAAYDGPAAVNAAADFAPDAILLDIGLPGMDGFATARALRAREDQPRALLIALTGYGSDEDRQRAREAGFDHYLVKPPDIKALTELLADLPTD